MRRDMGTVRDLLKLAAESDGRANAYAPTPDEEKKRCIAYHVRTMTQACLVKTPVIQDATLADIGKSATDDALHHPLPPF